MRALQYKSYGGPEVLEVAEAPEPHAGPGQIRIAVKAASVNAFDWKLRSGMMAGGKPLEAPAYLGFDAAGVVDEVGEGVTGVAVGDDVFGNGDNTQAEYAVLDAWARKPPRSTGRAAAAAGVAAETARAGPAAARRRGRRHPVHRRWGRRRRRGGQPVRDRARCDGHRLRRTGQPGLPARDRRHPGALRPGDGRPGPRRAWRPRIDAVLDVVGKTPIEDLVGLAPEPTQVVSIANFGAAECGRPGDRWRRGQPSR